MWLQNDYIIEYHRSQGVSERESGQDGDLSLLHFPPPAFRFTPPPGVPEDELDLTPVAGFSLTPSPHKLCAIVQEGF